MVWCVGMSMGLGPIRMSYHCVCDACADSVRFTGAVHVWYWRRSLVGGAVASGDFVWLSPCHYQRPGLWSETGHRQSGSTIYMVVATPVRYIMGVSIWRCPVSFLHQWVAFVPWPSELSVCHFHCWLLSVWLPVSASIRTSASVLVLVPAGVVAVTGRWAGGCRLCDRRSPLWSLVTVVVTMGWPLSAVCGLCWRPGRRCGNQSLVAMLVTSGGSRLWRGQSPGATVKVAGVSSVLLYQLRLSIPVCCCHCSAGLLLICHLLQVSACAVPGCSARFRASGHDHCSVLTLCMRRFRFDPLVCPDCLEWVEAIRVEVEADSEMVCNAQAWLQSHLWAAGKWAFKQGRGMAWVDPALALELGLGLSGHSPAPAPRVVHTEVHWSAFVSPGSAGWLVRLVFWRRPFPCFCFMQGGH